MAWGPFEGNDTLRVQQGLFNVFDEDERVNLAWVWAWAGNVLYCGGGVRIDDNLIWEVVIFADQEGVVAGNSQGEHLPIIGCGLSACSNRDRVIGDWGVFGAMVACCSSPSTVLLVRSVAENVVNSVSIPLV